MKNSEQQHKKKHIVVVGGGFAGLRFAQRMSNNARIQLAISFACNKRILVGKDKKV